MQPYRLKVVTNLRVATNYVRLGIMATMADHSCEAKCSSKPIRRLKQLADLQQHTYLNSAQC